MDDQQHDDGPEEEEDDQDEEPEDKLPPDGKVKKVPRIFSEWEFSRGVITRETRFDWAFPSTCCAFGSCGV